MENRLRPIADHLKEKAPAYALAVVVGVGSLALMGEGNGEDPGQVNNPRTAVHNEHPTYTDMPEPQFTSHEDFCQQAETEQREPVKGC